MRWTEPALWQQNGAVTGYVVQYHRQTSKGEAFDCSVGQPLFISVDVNTTEYEGSALLAGSVYKLSVAGKTRAGTGVFSACTSISVPSSASASSSTGTIIGIAAGVGGCLLVVLVILAIVYKRCLRQKVNAVGAEKLARMDEETQPAWMTGMWCVV